MPKYKPGFRQSRSRAHGGAKEPHEVYGAKLHVLSHDAGIKAGIWANQTEKGTRYNVTFERSYKDGEEWRSTQTFGRSDLLFGLMSQGAFAWIVGEPGNGQRA